jgi:hypothetical protein
MFFEFLLSEEVVERGSADDTRQWREQAKFVPIIAKSS